MGRLREFFKEFALEKLKKKRRKKILRKFLFLLLTVFLVYTYVGGNYGFIRIISLLERKKELQNESKFLQIRIVDLELEKKRLNEDLFYIEKLAREKYGMIGKDEVVIKFIPPPSDSTKK